LWVGIVVGMKQGKNWNKVQCFRRCIVLAYLWNIVFDMGKNVLPIPEAIYIVL